MTAPWLDFYTRSSAVLSIARFGHGIRRAVRREAGRSRRYDAPRLLEAESLPADRNLELPPSAPLDMALATATAATMVVLQQASILHHLERRDGFVGDYRSEVALSVVAGEGPGGTIALARLASEIVAEDVAGDSALVAEAVALSLRASERPRTAGSLTLPALVAATLLAALWRPGAKVGQPAIGLRDDPRQRGGPLGAPFDGVGAETRVTDLAETGAESRLGHLRTGYADPPARAPANLQILARTPVPRLADADFDVVAIEELDPGPPVRVRLIGRARESGEPIRVHTTLTLARFLGAITGTGVDVAWAPGAGAVGSPSLRLELR